MEAEETMECLQEFPEHHKMILDRLNEQREQDRFTDITLIVDGGWGGGRRGVGAGASPPFPTLGARGGCAPRRALGGVRSPGPARGGGLAGSPSFHRPAVLTC